MSHTILYGISEELNDAVIMVVPVHVLVPIHGSCTYEGVLLKPLQPGFLDGQPQLPQPLLGNIICGTGKVKSESLSRVE